MAARIPNQPGNPAFIEILQKGTMMMAPNTIEMINDQMLLPIFKPPLPLSVETPVTRCPT